MKYGELEDIIAKTYGLKMFQIIATNDTNYTYNLKKKNLEMNIPFFSCNSPFKPHRYGKWKYVGITDYYVVWDSSEEKVILHNIEHLPRKDFV